MTDVLAAVVRQEIDWSQLPAATPRSVRELLRRALDRDAKTRLRDIGEARVALSATDTAATRPEAPARPPAARRPARRRRARPRGARFRRRVRAAPAHGPDPAQARHHRPGPHDDGHARARPVARRPPRRLLRAQAAAPAGARPGRRARAARDRERARRVLVARRPRGRLPPRRRALPARARRGRADPDHTERRPRERIGRLLAAGRPGRVLAREHPAHRRAGARRRAARAGGARSRRGPDPPPRLHGASGRARPAVRGSPRRRPGEHDRRVRGRPDTADPDAPERDGRPRRVCRQRPRRLLADRQRPRRHLGAALLARAARGDGRAVPGRAGRRRTQRRARRLAALRGEPGQRTGAPRLGGARRRRPGRRGRGPGARVAAGALGRRRSHRGGPRRNPTQPVALRPEARDAHAARRGHGDDRQAGLFERRQPDRVRGGQPGLRAARGRRRHAPQARARPGPHVLQGRERRRRARFQRRGRLRAAPPRRARRQAPGAPASRRLGAALAGHLTRRPLPRVPPRRRGGAERLVHALPRARRPLAGFDRGRRLRRLVARRPALLLPEAGQRRLASPDGSRRPDDSRGQPRKAPAALRPRAAPLRERLLRGGRRALPDGRAGRRATARARLVLVRNWFEEFRGGR